ncbi:glutaredoxin family protein [Suttonella indologenes]|nr:glutaredoxin family protein [Suttonella indologenes]
MSVLTEEDGRMRWQLFVRPNCFLCAQAAQLLAEAGIAAQRLDVDSNPQWQAEYGLLVPVLYDSDEQRELIYPFDVEELRLFAGLPSHQS